MEKDLCILINGATRVHIDSIKECIENYKELFSWASFDVYLFTWKTEDDREQTLKNQVDWFCAEEFSPTEEQLDSLNVPYTGQLKSIFPTNKFCRIGHYSAHHSYQKLFSMVEETGTHYKFAVRARNDHYVKVQTIDWPEIIEKNSKAYITFPNLWCVGAGMNDHFGFGLFDVIKTVWCTDFEEFKQVLGASHNFEYVIETFVQKNGFVPYIVQPERYIIKRLGRTDYEPTSDWILK